MWISSKENIKPSNGALIIFGIWYDGWNYNTGYYYADIDKVILNDGFSEETSTHLELTDFECWKEIEEPPIEMLR